MLPVYGLLLQHYHIKCSSVLYKMDFFDPQQETLGETHFGIKWQKWTAKSSGDAQRWPNSCNSHFIPANSKISVQRPKRKKPNRVFD